MDTICPEGRSENMRRIRSTGTHPEWTVRKLVHGMGYRYRLHGKELPGRPDMVFVSRRKIVFVHGCFWHQHGANRCPIARMPKSNTAYWNRKLEGNRRRDARNIRRLRYWGWSVMVVWECELRNPERLAARLQRFLDS